MTSAMPYEAPKISYQLVCYSEDGAIHFLRRLIPATARAQVELFFRAKSVGSITCQVVCSYRLSPASPFYRVFRCARNSSDWISQRKCPWRVWHCFQCRQLHRKQQQNLRPKLISSNMLLWCLLIGKRHCIVLLLLLATWRASKVTVGSLLATEFVLWMPHGVRCLQKRLQASLRPLSQNAVAQQGTQVQIELKATGNPLAAGWIRLPLRIPPQLVGIARVQCLKAATTERPLRRPLLLFLAPLAALFPRRKKPKGGM